MMKESTIRRAMERGDDAAIKNGLRVAALRLIDKENLFADLRSNRFSDMAVRVPRATLTGDVQVIIRTSANPFSDPGTFFNSYAKKDSNAVMTIPKKKLILWGK